MKCYRHIHNIWKIIFAYFKPNCNRCFCVHWLILSHLRSVHFQNRYIENVIVIPTIWLCMNIISIDFIFNVLTNMFSIPFICNSRGTLKQKCQQKQNVLVKSTLLEYQFSSIVIILMSFIDLLDTIIIFMLLSC